MSRTVFTLFVIGQLLRAIVALNAGQPTTTMPVPADNVTVAGLESDVQLIGRENPSQYINPANPKGIVVPTTTTPVPAPRMYPLQGIGPTYHICPAYPLGGAPANVKC